MASLLPSSELARRYDRAARGYDAAWNGPLGKAEDAWVAGLLRANGLPGPVADLGCGTGLLARLVPEAPGYVGVDLSAGMLHEARRLCPGRPFVQAGMAGWLVDRAGELGSVVLLFGPLNLVEEPMRLVAHSARALRPGGRFYAVGRASGDRFEHEDVPMRPTPPAAMKRWVQNAGLRVLACGMVPVVNGSASVQAFVAAEQPEARP